MPESRGEMSYESLTAQGMRTIEAFKNLDVLELPGFGFGVSVCWINHLFTHPLSKNIWN
jgi:hypothetical protein